MLIGMLLWSYHLEIFWPVVSFIAVDVMNKFESPESATDNALDDGSMFVHFTAVDFTLFIWVLLHLDTPLRSE